MIGDKQIDIFNNGKVFGEGLMKIIKPIKVKGENVYKSFNEYSEIYMSELYPHYVPAYRDVS